MSQQTVRKIKVGGVVNVNKELGNDFPYSFFEIDTIAPSAHNFVLDQYKRFNLDVILHRIGKGYHYFGNAIPRQVWKEWYASLKPLNPKYPPLTLRVTRKFYDEVFERPVYIEARNVVPNWSKAIMHFLSKELRRENNTNIETAMNACGLEKYFKTTRYYVKVLVSQPTLLLKT